MVRAQAQRQVREEKEYGKLWQKDIGQQNSIF